MRQVQYIEILVMSNLTQINEIYDINPEYSYKTQPLVHRELRSKRDSLERKCSATYKT